MICTTLDALNRGELHLSIHSAVPQHWSDRLSYSYMEHPREEQAFFMPTTSESGGQFTYTLQNGRTLRPRDGQVVYTPCGARFRTVFSNPERPSLNSNRSMQVTTNLLIKFHLTDLQGHEMALADEPVLLDFLSVEKATRFMQEMCSAYVNHYAPQLLLKSQMYCFLHWMLNENENNQLHQFEKRQIMPALQHMMSNLAGRDSIGDLAAMCAMSESAFRRLFKEAVGMSPAQYRLKMRLEKAKVMLMDEASNVSHIALSLDFYDTAYFCKQFRRMIGMTPAEYRKSRAQTVLPPP